MPDKVYMAQWRARHRLRLAAKEKEKRLALRQEVLAAYGGACVCCGETITQFLAIDHIDGKGAEHRRRHGLATSTSMYAWLKRNGFPRDNYQVLCHNCNNAKGFYGACPHEGSR